MTVSPITNARVEAIAMVSTMKKMATALQEEQPGRSLVKAFIPGFPCTSFCDDYVADEDDNHVLMSIFTWLANELVKVPWLP